MKYELMVILNPKQTEKEIEKLLKEIEGLFNENGLKLLDKDLWGQRELAYKIKGQSSGFYVVMLFEGEPSGADTVRKDLRIQSGIVRYMMVKMPDNYGIVRYEHNVAPAPQKLNKHAEELQKKVSGRKTAEEKGEAAETSTEDGAKLEEKLQAIMEDTDLGL
jgi:small subunit ribosomal protein S6